MTQQQEQLAKATAFDLTINVIDALVRKFDISEEQAEKFIIRALQVGFELGELGGVN